MLRVSELGGDHQPGSEQRLKEGCRNAAQLWRELQEQGFTGSYAVYAWIVERRAPDSPGAEGPPDQQTQSRIPTPRTVTWWLLRPADQFTTTQATFLKALRCLSPRRETRTSCRPG